MGPDDVVMSALSISQHLAHFQKLSSLFDIFMHNECWFRYARDNEMRALIVVISLVFVVSVSESEAEHNKSWPSYQRSLKPGEWSPVKAELPTWVSIKKADADAPEEFAELIGKWDGWMCRNFATDIKLAIEEVGKDKAQIVYAAGAKSFGKFSERIWSTYDDDEMHGKLVSGSEIIIRRRRDILDIMWFKDSSNWCVGVLERM